MWTREEEETVGEGRPMIPVFGPAIGTAEKESGG